MEILTKNNNLDNFLRKLSGKVVTIVSAFASGTENVIDCLKNSNKVELIVGTINSFSSPNFFKHCVGKENLDFYVDFAYHNSTHWKLYLIDPDIVIIGSANFTNTGLSLERDTCVLIRSSDLLSSYKIEIDKIKGLDSVVKSTDKDFEIRLAEYVKSHHWMQAVRTRTMKTVEISTWLNDEVNQLVPLFVWKNTLSKEEKKAAEILQHDDSEGPKLGIENRCIFRWPSKKIALPYSQGDVVLCASSRGGRIGFYSFDRIIENANTSYIYSYKKNTNHFPFILSNEVKAKIKEKIRSQAQDCWLKISKLDRSEIASLFKAQLSRAISDEVQP